MNHSNEEYIRKAIQGNCSSVDGLIDGSVLTSKLRLWQTVHFDSIKQEWVVESSLEDIVNELKNKATEKRFEDMEFALDEEGRPDGIKNKQEMVLTIANDIADSIGELAFEEAKQALEEYNWLDAKAMQMLKESMED